MFQRFVSVNGVGVKACSIVQKLIKTALRRKGFSKKSFLKFAQLRTKSVLEPAFRIIK